MSPGGALESLNDAQRQAVKLTDRPVLVLAGPGTGKTKMLVAKYQHLVLDQGLDPDRILITTFTRKATDELGERIGAALDAGGHYSKIEVQNFHGLCLRILQEFHPDAARYRDPAILEGVALQRFLYENRDRLAWDTVPFIRYPDYPLQQLLGLVGRCISEDISPEEAVRRAEALVQQAEPKKRRKMEELLDHCRNYGRVLQLLDEKRVLTYDLMLYHAVQLLESDESARASIQDRYDYVLVDEVQDNNGLQASLIELIVGDRACVTVVGDEDQGIYKFRGAQRGILERFQKRFDPEVVNLWENYRSSPAIVESAKRLISHNPGRFDKKLEARGKNKDLPTPVRVLSVPDEEQEAIRIATLVEEEIRERDRRPKDIAVLYRSLNHLDRLLDELEAREIRYEITNVGQLLRLREVRDLVAWLSVLNDPVADNPSLVRVLSGPETGISLFELGKVKRAYRRMLRQQAIERGDERPEVHFNAVDTLRDLAKIPGIDDHTRHRLNWARRSIEVLSDKTRGHDAMGVAYDILGWLKVHRRYPPDDPTGQQVLANLGDFLQVIKDYEETYPDARGLDGFIDYLDYLDRRGADVSERPPDEGEDSVKILTAHRSKGLQWPVVIVANCADQRFPLRWRGDWLHPLIAYGEDVDAKDLHLQEERRTFYVAITRAEEQLILTRPRTIGGKERDPSSLLNELNGDDVEMEDLKDSLPASEGAGDERGIAVHTEVQGALAAHEAVNEDELFHRLKRVAQAAVRAWGEHVPRERLEALAKRVHVLELAVDHEPESADSGLKGPLRLSASALNTYANCPRQFQFKQVLRIPSRAGAAAVAGSNVHRALEEFHKRHQEDWRTKTTEDLYAVYEEAFAAARFETQEDAERWRERDLRALASYLDDEQQKAGEPRHFEVPFEVRLDDLEATFHGYIDRVDEHEDGSVEIIDYKTGSRTTPNKIVEEDYQIPLYVVAMEEKGLRVRAGALYWMRDAGDGKGPIQRDVIPRKGDGKPKGELTDEAMAAFRGRLKETIGAIRAGRFPEDPDDIKCKFCDYRPLCPAMEK